jgi:hypothetical protein
VLHGHTVPPVGGDTLLANQYAARDALPTELKGPCPLAIIDKRKIPAKEDT